jgi:hypothetical protein
MAQGPITIHFSHDLDLVVYVLKSEVILHIHKSCALVSTQLTPRQLETADNKMHNLKSKIEGGFSKSKDYCLSVTDREDHEQLY